MGWLSKQLNTFRNFKDPRIKTLGFFVFSKEKMKKSDLKQRMREVRFTTEHTLTEDQLNQLIRDKLERARIESENRKRVKNQLLT
jgi:Fe-S cluster assembly scaffold protein SufB